MKGGELMALRVQLLALTIASTLVAAIGAGSGWGP
jgi:hypothetical protein